MSKTTERRDSFLPPLWILSILGVVFFFWFIYEMKELVTLLVVSYAIAYVIDPALKWLEGKKIPRQYGVFIITIVLLLFIILSIVSAVPTLIEEFKNISSNFPNYLAKAKEKVLPLFEVLKKYLPQDPAADPNAAGPMGILTGLASPETLNPIFSGMFATLLSGYSITLTIVNLLLLPFIVYYISVDLEVFHSTMLGIFPRNVQGKVSKFFSEINMYVSAFVRGQLIVCSILFLLYAFGLAVIGVELWFLLAVISGFGNLIPYIGFLTGIVLSSIMALVTFGDFYHLIQVIVLYVIVQAMEGLLITPKIIGNSVGLSPLIIIIALFVGGQAFGLLGIFLAVPGAAIIRVAGKHLHQWVLQKSKA